MEAETFFPAFLIHDSPREADLSKNIYERLFTLAATLERCCGNVPLFQYILTTTTAPPDAFQNERSVRLKVKGAPAEERLFKVDL